MRGLSLVTKGMLCKGVARPRIGSGPIIRREDEIIHPIIECTKFEMKASKSSNDNNFGNLHIEVGNISIDED